MAIRSWTTPGPVLKGHTYQGDLFQQMPGTSGQIVSLSHDLRKLGGTRDIGGPFLLTKNEYLFRPGKVFGTDNSTWRTNGSQIYCEFSNSDITPGILSDSALNSLGATAYARSNPANPVSSASTFLGEALADGFPSMIGHETWQERANYARSAGSDYLNVEFGWLPLVSDIRSFASAVRNHHKIVSDFHEGSGKKTRFGYRFPATTSTTQNYNLRRAHIAGWDYAAAVRDVDGIYSNSLVQEKWFKGCITYYSPVGNDLFSKFQRWNEDANKLFGINITPDTLWNVAPWSWAVDWFTNAGDVVNNISSRIFDGVVLLYGYMMNQSEQRTEWTANSSTRNGQTWSSCGTFRRIKSCQRMPAHPYGFGVTDTSLTKSQAAITAALGLSHTRGGPG